MRFGAMEGKKKEEEDRIKKGDEKNAFQKDTSGTDEKSGRMRRTYIQKRTQIVCYYALY